MKSRKSKALIGITVLVVMSLMATAVVAAQAPEGWPFSSDPEAGETPGMAAAPGQAGGAADENGYTGAVIEAVAGAGDISGEGEAGQPVVKADGLQPDEDGYTGPLWNPETAQEASTDAEGGGEQVNWDALMTGPQLDDDAYAPEAPGWSNFYYVYAAGSTLRTRDSAQTWNNSGSGGCIYANNNASEVMNLHLDIPTGSRIDYLRIFYYDTSASNSTAWVTTYDGSSGFTDITNVSSAGNAGYGTNLSAYVGHVVDNVNYAYVLNWRPVVAGSTMMLCGLRVAYRLP